ncbi:hypothetical protein ACSS6N_23705 [Peribacillus frigoritolerans]|uniref:hypothetical protein n=1 Tax=Peribacillus frigoritolerans TaxID=450367 RepID=UPI003F875EED
MTSFFTKETSESRILLRKTVDVYFIANENQSGVKPTVGTDREEAKRKFEAGEMINN